MAETNTQHEDRRGRYQNDADYRASEQARARDAYWAEREAAPVRERLCRYALVGTRMIDGGVERNIVDPVTAVGRRAVTFTMVELSILMGKNSGYITRQVGKGIWPEPVFIVSATEFAKSPIYVYTCRQARAILRVFAKHEESFSYYRTGHRRTRVALYRAMEAEYE